jgi:hypothetical protein
MTNRMWGGRFGQGPAEIMEEINASIGFDQRLYAQDIAGSKAHAGMLAERGIISPGRCRRDHSRARSRAEPTSPKAGSHFREPWRTST